MDPVLQVRSLSVRFKSNGILVPAVRDVSFDIGRCEVVGVLGESGSGKSTLAIALLQLLAPSGKIVAGSIRFNGHELRGLDEKQLERIRGAEISLVFQEPAISLSPVMRVGPQIANVIRVHHRWSRTRCREHTEKLLAELGLSERSRIYDAYPHELSSGQKQRVAIAQAIACKPAIVIADEPTANLDSTTRAQILDIFKDMRAHYNVGLLFITHNPALLTGFADRVMVMYAGQIVEQGSLESVFERPLHPYTAALLHSIPDNRAVQSGRRALLPIVGNPPDLAHLPDGCAFELRCLSRTEVCRTRLPDPTQSAPGQWVRCFNARGTQ
jgi:oligopeptide/dipeptide ABC transporter ATP-binding protein